MQSSSEWQTFKLDYNFAINLRPRVAQEVPVDYSGLYMSVLTLTKEIEKESTTSTEVFWKYAGIVKFMYICIVITHKNLSLHLISNTGIERISVLISYCGN